MERTWSSTISSQAFWRAVLLFIIGQGIFDPGTTVITVSAQNCFGGIETFEKTVNGVFDSSIIPAPLLEQKDQALMRDCVNLCKQQSQCLSFVLDYGNFRCDAYLVNSVGRRDQINVKPRVNYLEKICFRGVDKQMYDNLCNDRLWAFERVKGAFMEGFLDKEVNNILTKEDCEKLCLTEMTFVCRSADYDEARQKCRMSREDRRSQPQAFREVPESSRDYLENQCAAAAPTSCRYEMQRDVAPVSMDKLEFATTPDDCQTQCDRETTFNCRGYAFLDNRCYLSADDAFSLGREETKRLVSKIDSTYGEKICVIEQCTGGVFTYEKITGFVLRGAMYSPITLGQPTQLGITLECQESCQKEGLDCPAFVVNYQNSRCDKLDRNSQGRTPDLTPRDGDNYFEKVCLRGTGIESCKNKAWAFERVLGYQMKQQYYQKHYDNINSRRDCEEYCLNERSFVCRSAMYNDDTTECRLSPYDRRTDPEGLEKVQSSRINYLENQCLSAMTQCPYERTPEYYPTYTDFVQTIGITSEDTCKQYCTTFQSFVCRSFAYYSSNGQCFISGDDKASGGSMAVMNRPGLVYYERNCQAAGSTTTSTYPVTLSPTSSPITPSPGNSVDQDTYRPQEGASSRKKCGTGERYVYDKMTGYDVYGAVAIPLYRAAPNELGITDECVRRCDQTEDCNAFIEDYVHHECFSIKVNTIQGSADLRPYIGKSFFQGSCLPVSISCDKMWAFELVPDHELRGATPRDILRSVSRLDCKRKCLQERAFQCKSMNYYPLIRECRLYMEDRLHTLARLQYAGGVEYLENQCGIDISGCPYAPIQRNVYMLYVTKTLLGATSTFQCEQECSKARDFNCRSFTYQDYGALGTGKCLLSSESRATDQIKALQGRPRAVYVEKDCSRQSRQSSTIYPPTTYPSSYPQPYPTSRPQPYPTSRPQPYPTARPQPYPTSYPRPQTTPIPRPSDRPAICRYDQYTFEKTKGFDVKIFRRERVRTRSSVGIVSECQAECLRIGERCKGFVLQYTTFQSCYWLDAAVGNNNSFLIPQSDSVYFEKICLKEKLCNKLWSFERSIGFEMLHKPEKIIPGVTRRSDCEDYCLSETHFACRAATYDYDLRMCHLYSETKRTNPGSYQKSRNNVDYLENQCIQEPSTCQYRDFIDRLFPHIDRLSKAFSLVDCQRQCDTERQFTCRGVNFETIAHDCALTSSDTSTDPKGENALVFRRNSIFSEKGTCEQVSVQCNQQDMVLTLNFGNPFIGRVYAKGNPAQCYMVGTSQTKVQFAISLGSRCGTRQDGPGKYVNEVVVQQHPIIMTDNDKKIQVICSFDSSDRTVTLGQPVGIGPPGVDVSSRFEPSIASIVANTVPPPHVIMRITDKFGRDAKVVGLGDELTLRIELKEQQSVFAIFARNLYARSSNGESLFLIDSSGCPTDATIFPALQRDPNDKRTLVSDFKAFRFPSTGMVNFEVQIRFCQDRCEPVRCASGMESFGRRRRSVDSEETILSTEDSTILPDDPTTAYSQDDPDQTVPIIAPNDAVLVNGHLYQNRVPANVSLSNEGLPTTPKDNDASLQNGTTMDDKELGNFTRRAKATHEDQAFSGAQTQPWYPGHHQSTPSDNGWKYSHLVPKEIDELPPLPEGGKHPPIHNPNANPMYNPNMNKSDEYPNLIRNSPNSSAQTDPYTWHTVQSSTSFGSSDPKMNHPFHPNPFPYNGAVNPNQQPSIVPLHNPNTPAYQGPFNPNAQRPDIVPLHNSNPLNPGNYQNQYNSDQRSDTPHLHGYPYHNANPNSMMGGAGVLNGRPQEVGAENLNPNANGIRGDQSVRQQEFGGQNYGENYHQSQSAIYASTMKPMPDEMPLSLAIQVGGDQPEDASWSIERIPRPVTSTEKPEALCPSQTTIIVTAVTVTLVHIALITAAICWYRWQKKKQLRKSSDEEVTFPAVTSAPAVSPSTSSSRQAFYASPEVTFRSVYGVYESPP